MDWHNMACLRGNFTCLRAGLMAEIIVFDRMRLILFDVSLSLEVV